MGFFVVVGDVNNKVTILENYMNSILDDYAPYKTFTVKKPILFHGLMTTSGK